MAKKSTDPVVLAAAAKGMGVKKVLDSVHPPREIRENTKARRAWLAEALAALEAENVAGELPALSAKIVGNGSYQNVSVTRFTYTAVGRVRLRGICQYCGHEQVTENGALVLHGYNRPGWGYIVNECPGARRLALQLDTTDTARWLEAEQAALPKLAATFATIDTEYKAACAARDASTEYGTYAKPSKPSARGHYVGRHYVEGEPSAEQAAQYVAKMAAWEKEYPLTAAADRVFVGWNDARQAMQACETRRDHFAALLASGVHGTPLTPEVVA